MRALVYCNFLREIRLGGWGSEGPTLGQNVRFESCSMLDRGKRKHIMRFEIRYFLLEVGLSPSTS